MKKICPGCRIEKDYSEYNPSKNTKNKIRTYCKECSKERTKQWREDNPEKMKILIKRGGLKRKFGITIEQYNSIEKSQKGKCAICNRPPIIKDLAVDHIHGTNQIRGLLCANCNIGLGYFEDNSNFLRSAIKYLKRDGLSPEKIGSE